MVIRIVFTFLFFLNINSATAQDCETLSKVTKNLQQFENILGDNFNPDNIVIILNELKNESLSVDTLINDIRQFGKEPLSSRLRLEEVKNLLSIKYEHNLRAYPLSLIHQINADQLEELVQFNRFIMTSGIKTADDLITASDSYKKMISHLSSRLTDVKLAQYEDILRNFHHLDNNQVENIILSLERGNFPRIPEALVANISQRNSFISKVQEIFSERARDQYRHRPISRAYPGGAHPTRSKSLVNVETSVSQIARMAKSGTPGVPEDYARSFIAAVEQDSFAEFFRSNKKTSPYTAGAIDPQTGIYSIRKNVDHVPSDLHEVIQGNIDELGENYATHITESISRSQTEDTLSDGSQHIALQAAGIPGLHAEVLAASDVLNFKKTLKNCLRDVTACSGKFTCFTSTPITCDPTDFDHIRFSIEAISICKQKLDICFPDSETPKDFFFDVRGTNKTTVSQGISPSPTSERFRATKFRVISKQSDKKKLYRRLGLEQNQVSIFCQNKTRFVEDCTQAYANAIHQFCSSQNNNCSEQIKRNFDAFMTEAKEALIKTLENNTDQGLSTKMGAGHRCFNCWHILDRGELKSTLIQH